MRRLNSQRESQSLVGEGFAVTSKTEETQRWLLYPRIRTRAFSLPRGKGLGQILELDQWASAQVPYVRTSNQI